MSKGDIVTIIANVGLVITEVVLWEVNEFKRGQCLESCSFSRFWIKSYSHIIFFSFI